MPRSKARSPALSTAMTIIRRSARGNHDEAGAAGLAKSGDNDPSSGKYGVFVINEDDYMWYNNDEATIKRTAENLRNYLNHKLAVGFKARFSLSPICRFITR
mgnify:CR=1 FL=1